MAKKYKQNKLRGYIQGAWTVVSNGYLVGFVKGRIWQGDSKSVCVPGLNCYSCPGALGACPIGSLQAELAARDLRFPLYVVGFLLAFGALFGRFVCGFLCPFGWVQDLLYKIPSKKIRTFKYDRLLRYLKYVVLAVLVKNAAGVGLPWFCKWVCPSGTLFAGIPLLLANPTLRAVVGFIFSWKMAILILILGLSVFLYRPFCKYLCPLGATYALFNKVSFYRLKLDESACTHCGTCKRACKMGVDPSKRPDDLECIRCGDCVKNCPTKALSAGYFTGKRKTDAAKSSEGLE
ncbi:MAG: 4Fe-4S binding protein [Eubacteriales bacterium]